MLTTSRLILVPATPVLIAAELESAGRLAELLDAIVPPDWPPEHHDAETLRFWSEQLSRSGGEGWWLHYMVVRNVNPRTLVGTVSFKGPPVDGTVEIGYSVVPSCQRRGLATEASRALIEAAWGRGAEVVVAHTLPDLKPSISVLEKLGFAASESSEPDILTFALRRE